MNSNPNPSPEAVPAKPDFNSLPKAAPSDLNVLGYAELVKKAEKPETFVQEKGAKGEILTLEDVETALRMMRALSRPTEEIYQSQKAEFVQRAGLNEQYYDEAHLVRFRDEARVKTELAQWIHGYIQDAAIPLETIVGPNPPEKKKTALLQKGIMEAVVLSDTIALQVLQEFSDDQEVIDAFFQKVDSAYFDRTDVTLDKDLFADIMATIAIRPNLSIQCYEKFKGSYLAVKLENTKDYLRNVKTFSERMAEYADYSIYAKMALAEIWTKEPQWAEALLNEISAWNKNKTKDQQINLDPFDFEYGQLKSKEYTQMFFKALPLAIKMFPQAAERGMRVFNELYEKGYLAHEADQLEVAQRMTTDTLLRLVAQCDRNHLNISHKILLWNLVGEPAHKIPAKPKAEIIKAFMGLTEQDRQSFMLTSMDRAGRDAFFLNNFTKAEKEVFLKETIQALFKPKAFPDIFLAPGLEHALNNPVFGDLFTPLFIEQLRPHHFKLETLAIFLEKNPHLEGALKAVIEPHKEQLSELRRRVRESAQLSLSESLRDNVYRSATLFVWDSEKTGDDESAKAMQLSNFWDTFVELRSMGYKVTLVNDSKKLITTVIGAQERVSGGLRRLPTIFEGDQVQKIVMEKNINGIRSVHELILSNNNANQDFRALAEAKNKDGTDRYEQITLRGHCWSNQEAVLGSAMIEPIKRSGDLVLIHGGCFQEINTEDFSNILQHRVFQVATALTGMGAMTRPLSIVYPEIIIERYLKTHGSVDMMEVDKAVKKEPFYAQMMDRVAEAAGYNLTTDGLHLAPRVHAIKEREAMALASR